MKKIYSIGYGSRDINDFISLLKRNEISVLVDIRTLPASRFRPDYNKKKFSEKLRSEGIEYVFLGNGLGGKPKDKKVYTNNLVDYDKIACSTTYQKDINELLKLASDEIVCIMCAELKPTECHRKNLVGNSLYKLGINIKHIDEKGDVVSHSAYDGRLF